jgi:hypothetical protein
VEQVYAVVNGNEIKLMAKEEAKRKEHLWFKTREEAVEFILISSR